MAPFDSKLKWGPHLATIKAKMESQKRALTIVAGTTWGGHTTKGPTGVHSGGKASYDVWGSHLARPTWNIRGKGNAREKASYRAKWVSKNCAGGLQSDAYGSVGS